MARIYKPVPCGAGPCCSVSIPRISVPLGMLQKSKIKKSLVHEVEMVYIRQSHEESVVLTSSPEVYAFLHTLYDMRKVNYKEFFFVILLNKSNRVLGYSQIGVGSTDAVMVNIKEIFQLAVISNASGIMISHNHPSGGIVPSDADKAITKRIKLGCTYFDTTLLDHIIYTPNRYYSFADDGIL